MVTPNFGVHKVKDAFPEMDPGNVIRFREGRSAVDEASDWELGLAWACPEEVELRRFVAC